MDKKKIKTLENLLDQRIATLQEKKLEKRMVKPQDMPPVKHDPKERLVDPAVMNKLKH